jgi:pimeloyl-ACP methyl ester carboxylesterase
VGDQRGRQASTGPGRLPEGVLRELASSQQAGAQAAQRIFGRTTNVDEPTTWQTRQAQYDAVCGWGLPNHALLQRLSAITQPVFIANGDSDPMIPPHFSYLLAGLIPGAKVKIYPDSAHGFLFQHHAEFAADVEQFLRDSDIDSSSIGGPDE